MKPVFVPWWILVLTAAIFLALAVAHALDGVWWAVALWIAFAGLSAWVASIHRRRLRERERQTTT